MSRTRLVVRDLLGSFVILGLAISCIPDQAWAERRHHITLGLGYTKLLSDDLKDESIGVDFTNAANGVFAYRYTLNPSVDLTIDSRATVSVDSYAGVDLAVANSFFGPGVRWHPTGSAPVYLQGNVFFVNEEAEAQQGGITVTSSEGGAGFGVMGGVDFRLSDLLSLPVEMNYLHAKPADDVSGLGITVGLTFNFGQMP